MVDSGDAARAEESGTIALPIDDFPGFLRLMARGLTRRCPWCGDRKAYFTGWFARVDRCRRCRHPYRRGDEAFELGATTANIILTFLSILIAILVAVILTLPDIPTVPVVVIVGLSATGILPLTLVGFAQATGAIVVVIAALYFAWTIAFVCRDATERKRIGVCAILFVGAAMFWSGFEQAGSSMNLFRSRTHKKTRS